MKKSSFVRNVCIIFICTLSENEHDLETASRFQSYTTFWFYGELSLLSSLLLCTFALCIMYAHCRCSFLTTRPLLTHPKLIPRPHCPSRFFCLDFFYLHEISAAHLLSTYVWTDDTDASALLQRNLKWVAAHQRILNQAPPLQCWVTM